MRLMSWDAQTCDSYLVTGRFSEYYYNNIIHYSMPFVH